MVSRRTIRCWKDNIEYDWIILISENKYIQMNFCYNYWQCYYTAKNVINNKHIMGVHPWAQFTSYLINLVTDEYEVLYDRNSRSK